jgi:DNA-binding CsgD family transcriptional regulator
VLGKGRTMQPLPAGEPSAAEGKIRCLALLDIAERIGGLGSSEWIPATGTMIWSDNLFRLLGREPGSVTPSPELVSAQIHAEDRERVKAAQATLAAGGDIEPLDYRIIRRDGMLRHFRTTIVVVQETADGARRLITSVQDVTSRRRLDRKLEAYAAVARAVDEWEAFEPGAEGLLAALAESLDFAFGAFWISGSGVLRPKVLWHPPSPALAAVARATEEWGPGRGSPVLGRAWESRQPFVSAQPWAGCSTQRTTAIREAGLHAVVAVPAVAVDETLAVLEFLSYEPVEVTDQLLRVLTGIGHEIGYFLARHRGDLLRPVLTQRQRQILQLAARSNSAADIAGNLFLSPATVKRHFEDSYAALGVSDRAAAVGEAMRRGLIT